MYQLLIKDPGTTVRFFFLVPIFYIVSDLLPGRRLRYVAADIGTNPAASGLTRSQSSLAARAITIMTEMRDNGSLAFIGPDDSCSSEALVAAAWNLPMISYVSNFVKSAFAKRYKALLILFIY